MRESLASLVQRDGPLPVELVREVGLVASEALGHAHARGVVHRDVKPANLLVSDFDEIALGDFDIAAVGDVASSTFTLESMSPPHAPPERLNGEVRPGPAGDIWSLGSTLFTLLEGQPPFGSAQSPGGMAGLMDRVRHQPMPPIRSPGVPPEFEAVIRRALEKEPADRWPDARSMRAAIESVALAGRPEHRAVSSFAAEPPSDMTTRPPREPIPRPTGRRDIPWASLAVTVAVAASVAVALIVGLR
jgi:eukaryotic-like serine/threonine-protein kinase